MKIIKPKVELWTPNDATSHIARCAKVCYAAKTYDDSKTGRSDDHLVNDLYDNKHFSMFRHHSEYYIIPINRSIIDSIIINFKNCPYVELDKDANNLYIVTNGHFVIDHPKEFEAISEFKVDKETFAHYEVGYNHLRYTFNVITQISTSRELNRVSPNNIAEQSTRYCNFSRGKFEGECTICQPHWFDLKQKEVVYFKYINGIQHYKIDDGEYLPYKDIHVFFNKYQTNINKHIMFQNYMFNTNNSCTGYLEQVKLGMLPQDARGELPLDLATECVYTYSINEWRHILDLRYYGTTGAPHPNAKIIVGMVRDELINLGYKFR